MIVHSGKLFNKAEARSLVNQVSTSNADKQLSHEELTYSLAHSIVRRFFGDCYIMYMRLTHTRS